MTFFKNKLIIICLLMLQFLFSGTMSAEGKKQGVTYRQVLRQVARHNLVIAAGRMETLSKEWLWRQSKAWSNPEVEIEVENFGGQLLHVEEEPAALTATVSQRLELGGKRGKKRRMARFTWNLAKNDAESLRLDVLQAAGEGFITLITAQELERHADEFSQQGQEMYRIIESLVGVGKISPLILKKAGVVLADADILLNNARQRRLDARRRLAVLWNETDVSFDRAVGSLNKRYKLPSAEALWERVRAAPGSRRQRLTEGLSKTAVSHEKVAVIPDIQVTGGLRKLRHVDGHKYVAAVSFQLPLLDWNKGNIKAAKYHLQKNNALSKDFMNKLQADFRETYRLWTSAGEEARILETKSLAALEQLYEDTLVGYKAGKFSFLEVLEAQQALIASKQQYVGVLYKFHLAALKLARMAGTTLDKLLANEQPFE